MLDSSTIEQLVRELLIRTQAGDVEWTVSPVAGFEYRGSAGAVRVLAKDNDDRYPFVLQLLNAGGDVADQFETWTYADDNGDVYPTPESEAVADLFAAAKNSAKGVLQIVQGLL